MICSFVFKYQGDTCIKNKNYEAEQCAHKT